MDLQKKIKVVSEKNSRILLPNLITIIGVCIGLSSIKFALDSKFELSIIAILFAALMDSLDGRVARLIKGTSKVGKELDSLTDVISFGVAPAFIMYFWHLNQIEKVGWLLSLTYVVCVALRLARFNVTSNIDQEWKDNFFQGVPAPAGAILVLMPLILQKADIFLIDDYTYIASTMFIIVPLLMISKIPTYSLKKIIIPRKATVFLLFGIGIFVGLLIIYTFKTVFVSGVIYIFLIPASAIHYNKMIKSKSHRAEIINNDDDQEDML
jgi:CDP-diacylglycerol--serine O-phosphatidyltransferase|tara:strand:- start:3695 stop:4495 length:801 start_codon:yes stop_codon:yes gene_type:complete